VQFLFQYVGAEVQHEVLPFKTDNGSEDLPLFVGLAIFRNQA
jgi:hypothetical protein